MRAISLTQPWATLVAIGAKRYETRSWRTRHTGPLAIHATAAYPGWAKSLALTEPFARRLSLAGYRDTEQLPRGAILAVVDLVWWHSVEDFRPQRSSDEAAFGDYSAGRWAWRLENVRKLIHPVGCRGGQGLWTVLPETLALIEAAIGALA